MNNDTYQKGLDEFKSGNYADAITTLSEYLNVNPGDATAWNVKGVALAKIGKYQAAVYCYDKALALQPGNDKFMKNREIVARKIKPQLQVQPKDYKTSWLLILCFFLPFFNIGNIGLIIITIIVVALIVYIDSRRIGAGISSTKETYDTITWSPTSWGLGVALLFIIFMPVYLWKRKAIFELNERYVDQASVGKTNADKFAVILIIICLVMIVINAISKL
jgi:tetratricopeptide (TPR) repeat protein